METRVVTAADLPALAALHAKSFGPAAWRETQLCDSFYLPTTLVLAVFDPGVARGFILCQHAGDQAEILTLCVDPTARRQGIGRLLLDAARRSLRERGCERLFLDVAADNDAARALYEKEGFCRAGTRRGYYPRAGGAVDAALYTLPL